MTEQALVDTLHGRGYRVTPQRVLVRETLQRSGAHLSAQDVHGAVQERFPGVELSTVYRILELFVRLDLVAKSDLGEGAAVYEWCPGSGAHSHLVCEQCGGVTHFDDARIAELVEEACAAADFAAQDVELTVTGTCSGCAGTAA